MQKSYLSLGEYTLSHCHVVGCSLECWRIVIDISNYNCHRYVTFQIWASVVSCLEESKMKLDKVGGNRVNSRAEQKIAEQR